MQTFETREDLIEMLPKGGTWVELGVFKGDFAETLFKTGKPERLLLVDLWPENNFSADVHGNGSEIFGSELYDMVKDRFKEHTNIHLFRSMTYFVLEQIPDETISVIYIDADHTYETVRKDLDISLKKTKVGGIISGHDYIKENFSGVYRAVNEFCIENKLKIDFMTLEKHPSYGIIKK